ncbi:MAG TPA: cation:dicarboxylase symporter family transporter, partial [Vicinamibacterales bacterium]|nr:cation:dicarboxylase symporter family transporter [Vicinamibacterales bacterium]
MTRPGTPHASFDVRAAGAARLLETYRGEAKGAAGLTEGAFGVDTFVRMVPRNPIAAAAAGEMLAMIVFALIFGVTARFGFDVLVSLLKYVATFGVSLTLPQQLVVVVMAVVTAVGAAGVPGGSIP